MLAASNSINLPPHHYDEFHQHFEIALPAPVKQFNTQSSSWSSATATSSLFNVLNVFTALEHAGGPLACNWAVQLPTQTISTGRMLENGYYTITPMASKHDKDVTVWAKTRHGRFRLRTVTESTDLQSDEQWAYAVQT